MLQSTPYASLHPASLFAACLPQRSLFCPQPLSRISGLGEGGLWALPSPLTWMRWVTVLRLPRVLTGIIPAALPCCQGISGQAPSQPLPTFSSSSHSELWPLRSTTWFHLSCLLSPLQLPSTSLCQPRKPSYRKASMGTWGL